MKQRKGNGGVGIAWLGVLIAWGCQYIDGWLWLGLLIISLILSVYGCWLWRLRKNRHWAFCLWGLVAPVGFLGVSLLKDKSLENKDAKEIELNKKGDLTK